MSASVGVIALKAWRLRALARTTLHKSPPLLQSETSECGLACMAMVLGHHGARVDLGTLRDKAPGASRGRTIAALAQLAADLGFTARVVRISTPSALATVALPAILHWDANHYVLLVAVQDGHFVVNDPALGQRTIGQDALFDHFTGIAVVLEPQHDFDANANVNTTGRKVWSFLAQGLKQLKNEVGRIFAAAILLEMLTLAAPQVARYVFDSAVLRNDVTILGYACIALATLIAFQSITLALRGALLIRISRTLTQWWSTGIFGHLLRLPTGWFERRHVGDIASRFGGIGQIQQALSVSFVDAVLNALMSVVLIVMLVAIDPFLAMFCVLAIVLLGTFAFATEGRLRHAAHAYATFLARERGYFLETLRGIRTLHALGHVRERTSDYANKVVSTGNASQVLRSLDVTIQSFNHLILNLTRLCLLYFGAQAAFMDQLTVGQLIAVLAYGDLLSNRAAALFGRLSDLRTLRVEGERLSDIVLASPEEWSAAPQMAPRDEGGLKITALTVRDAQGRAVLDRCNLTVADGEYVAIMGASGSGKTTLLSCILRMRQADEGTVTWNGGDVQHIPLQQYRALFGAVLQDESLFSGTIRDNITMFGSPVDEVHLQECARIACVDQFVSGLPMRYETMIGDSGMSLSGGERQRVMIARALYRRPRILILDEATSALNGELVDEINRNVTRLNMTRIVVSHRASTFLDAHRVLELNNGTLVDRTQATAHDAQG